MFRFYEPSRVLAPFVKQYWTLDIHNKEDIPHKQTIIPNGLIEIMFHYGEQINRISQNKTNPNKKRSIICGQRSIYYDIFPTGKIGILSAILKPEGAMMFLDIPVSEINNETLSMEDVFPKDAITLEDQLLNSRTNEHRIRILEAFLLSKIIEKRLYDHRRMAACLNKIKSEQALIKCSELAECVCLSNKQFQRRFKEYIGILPKEYLRVIRFQNVIHKKHLKPDLSLTQLSYECGFYDQSHFIHDFREFSGMTPKEFFKIADTHSDFFT
jgi:AraC-like DNA-binding protein